MASNFKARYSSYREPIQPLTYAAWALRVTIADALSKRDFRTLFSLTTLRDVAFVRWWHELSAHFTRFERTKTAIPKLVPVAYGTVLELGPATGNQLSLYDTSKISHIYGIESNPYFLTELSLKISEANLADKYSVIIGGAEDSEVLDKHGIQDGTLDCILSLQVLCSVPQPEAVAKQMYRLLKPGGMLIFWEHHANHDRLTRCIQGFWNLIWPYAIGGCNLNRDMRYIISQAGAWQNFETIEGDEKAWSMLPRIWGGLVKAEA